MRLIQFTTQLAVVVCEAIVLDRISDTNIAANTVVDDNQRMLS